MSSQPAIPAIEATALGHSFGDRRALSDVSCSVESGELLAVVGPNGAGKTTLLSILAGQLEPTDGDVRATGSVSLVPQTPALYRRLTVAENLSLFARLGKVPDVDGAVATMLAQAGLEERRDDLAGRLSGGGRQRVNIAIGLLSQPAVLLLDEPSSGLDPRQRERLWGFVLGLAGAGTAVVYSTHDLAEAERHGDRVLVLDDGECRYTGEPGGLRSAAATSGDTDFEAAFLALLANHEDGG